MDALEYYRSIGKNISVEEINSLLDDRNPPKDITGSVFVLENDGVIRQAGMPVCKHDVVFYGLNGIERLYAENTPKLEIYNIVSKQSMFRQLVLRAILHVIKDMDNYSWINLLSYANAMKEVDDRNDETEM